MTAVAKTKEERRREYLRRLQSLRPIDDDFMRCLFKDNIPLAQLVLRIITGKPDLVITRCQVQKDMKRLAGARSLCLDACGVDSAGNQYDLEIQRADKGAEPHRARYHSSVMDVENLDAGQDFSELPETFIIFIVEKDFYGIGEPLYPIERINLATGKPFGDGELYVNGQYRGDTDLGRLMHDFSCTDAAKMNFELIADRTRYLKESPKGVGEMCKLIEDLVLEEREESRKEGRQEGKKEKQTEVVLHMFQTAKLPPEKIAELSGIPLEEVQRILEKEKKE